MTTSDVILAFLGVVALTGAISYGIGHAAASLRNTPEPSERTTPHD